MSEAENPLVNSLVAGVLARGLVMPEIPPKPITPLISPPNHELRLDAVQLEAYFPHLFEAFAKGGPLGPDDFVIGPETHELLESSWDRPQGVYAHIIFPSSAQEDPLYTNWVYKRSALSEEDHISFNYTQDDVLAAEAVINAHLLDHPVGRIVARLGDGYTLAPYKQRAIANRNGGTETLVMSFDPVTPLTDHRQVLAMPDYADVANREGIVFSVAIPFNTVDHLYDEIYMVAPDPEKALELFSEGLNRMKEDGKMVITMASEEPQTPINMEIMIRYLELNDIRFDIVTGTHEQLSKPHWQSYIGALDSSIWIPQPGEFGYKDVPLTALVVHGRDNKDKPPTDPRDGIMWSAKALGALALLGTAVATARYIWQKRKNGELVLEGIGPTSAVGTIIKERPATRGSRAKSR